MGGRLIYRHRRSSLERWCASHTVAACNEKPAMRASGGLFRASFNGGTITNTVYFEGIPTLSQYGTILLILPLARAAFVAYRRMV